MATGVIKNTTIIGIKTEATEGTYIAPAAVTDYLNPNEDGFELKPKKELVDRAVLDSNIGYATPRPGMKGVEVSLPVEWRASGTEGSATNYDLLYKGSLGGQRQITTTTTTKATGNTGSILQIQDADISKFTVGDYIVIKEAGAHLGCFVTAKATGVGVASITVTPAKATGSYSNSVVISKSTTYFPANSGHPALSLSYYWGNTIVEQAIGCKVKSMALDSFETGKLASMNFGLEGLSFNEIDGAAPHTPTFDTGLPPLILNACVYQDGVTVALNKFSLSLDNDLGFLTSTCDSGGKIASRVVSRKIKGSFNPYKDDTSVAYFTKFNANTEFALVINAFNPSSVAGEGVMGSFCGIYLPKCILTEKSVGNKDGILTEELSFTVSRGVDGQTDEIFVGFV
jgi:hypothetical protein